ncbi:hypothetical protein BD779DRAFT_1479087 [Infundibulicybe gibba]|nr:hypothetical protein BD779DRAFT_1479087 [Infundibulicybe gibba]
MPPRKRGFTDNRFEICAHTCGCDKSLSRRGDADLNSCPIYSTPGRSGRRHASSSQCHPQCRAGCPGFQGQCLTREPTEDEWSTWAPVLATKHLDLVNQVRAMQHLQPLGTSVGFAVGGGVHGAGNVGHPQTAAPSLPTTTSTSPTPVPGPPTTGPAPGPSTTTSTAPTPAPGPPATGPAPGPPATSPAPGPSTTTSTSPTPAPGPSTTASASPTPVPNPPTTGSAPGPSTTASIAPTPAPGPLSASPTTAHSPSSLGGEMLLQSGSGLGPAPLSQPEATASPNLLVERAEGGAPPPGSEFPTRLSPIGDSVILFVPDPSRGEKLTGNLTDVLTWVDIPLTKTRYTEILKEFGSHIQPSEKDGMYWIQESLFTILMPNGNPPEFKYHVVPWLKFRNYMIGDSDDPEVRSKVAKANIVCCGVDLTIDFMLDQRALVWPHPQDMLVNGNKYSLAKNLHHIFPNTHPMLYSVTPGVMPANWQNIVEELGFVLKRSFSETTSHVVIPPKEKDPQRQWDELISSHADSTELYGRLGLTPACLYHHKGWVNNESQLSRDGKVGIEKLDEFVLQAVRELALLEEAQSGTSGLRIFCRMDVSVYQSEEGWWMYYVNEVDRTHNASLFAREDIGSARDVMQQALSAMKSIYLLSQEIDV